VSADPQIVELMREAGQARWEAWIETRARPAQIPHPTKQISLYIGGRGSGKSRAGAEKLCKQATTDPGAYALVGPDYSHLITEIVENYLFEMIPEQFRRWRGQVNQLDLANGSKIKLYTAEKPGKVRGPNLKGFWIDEPAEMRFGEDAWSNVRLATRIRQSNGQPPQGFVTGTPKRVKLMQHLLAQADERPQSYHLSTGTMHDNIANLDPETVEELYALYAGTNLGLQELEGIMIDDVDGALLTGAVIEQHRIAQATPGASLRAMSVDPGFSDKQTADETGILIGQRVGSGSSAVGELIDDASRRGTPGSWGDTIVDKTIEHSVDVIVYEGNMTGQWLKETIGEAFGRRGVKMPRLESVVSKSSKWARAEPVGALAERGRVKHVGTFARLEAELTSWVPDSGMRSPNRLDSWSQLWRYLLIKSSGSGGVGRSPTRRVGSIG